MPTANPLLDGFNDSPSSVDYNSNVDNYLEFLNKAEGSPKANIMYVTLTSSDLYDVKICKFKNLEVKPVFEAKGMYFDSLPSTFTQITGLYTSL